MHHDPMSTAAAGARSSAAAPPLPSRAAGREGELTHLTNLYRDAQRGVAHRTKLVLLEGPSGIGKSRILSELKSRVRLQGGVVLEGRCETGRAFGPFAEVVDRALRFLDEIGVAPEADLDGLACRGGCHRLWHQHGGPDAERVPFATDELPGATAETAAFEQRLQFFDAIAALLREVARLRAPLVVLDHVEKADRGTHELLEFLLEGGGPVQDRSDPLRGLFIASLRTDEGVRTPPGVDALRRHERAEPLTVGTLDLDGVRAYLQSQPALERVLERTGGVPEAIELLLEGQPLTPEARLAHRLEALGAPARALVEALAVLGRPADVEELARIAEVEPTPAARSAFAGLDLLSRAILDGRILFHFDRDADAERCYRLLTPERQAALHQRCAEVCACSVDLQEAVRHALAADDVDRASELAVVAAASLSARHAHGEAAALLESFVEATDEVPAAIREQLAELYRVSGDYPRALIHARALLEATPDAPAAAHRVGQLLTAAGEHEEAAAVLVRAHGLAEASEDPTVLGEVQAQLAELHYQVADYVQAAKWGRRALASAEASGDLVIEIHARNTLGKLALAQKDPTTAATYFEQNRDKAAAAGLGHQEAQAHTNYAVALLLDRDLAAAERACHTAIEVASRVCDTRERAIATENLAVIAHLGRDYGHALSYYHQAVGLLKRLGNRKMLARVANNLGELYLTLGERGRARGLCEFASRVGGKLPGSVLGESLLLEGRIEAADGDVTSARESFERARALFARLGSVRAAEASIELARMALFDGDVPEARAILSELPVDLPTKHQADLALVMADLERAAGGDTRAAARRAVELAEPCEDPERLLSALLRHARALGDAGEVGLATRVLERAQKLEEELTGRVPEEARGSWAERPVRAELTRVAGALANAWTRTRHESVPPPRALTGTHRVVRAASDERFTAWRERYPNLVGRSDALANVFGVLDKVSGADALVLVRGESGTGKELVAEAIHRNSPRRERPLVKVNCAALVETLLLSELFGHERGAFTGANSRKKGRFELADGGTIFLDEIGDISAKTQVALLRVLQEREFERVGGTQPIKVNVRIIAATHRDLEAMVREGTFREDLYYRLRGVALEMPPLRERLADLPDLCEHLLLRIAEERGEPVKRMSPEALEALARHRWPGNVRELENVLRSATLFADGPVLVPPDFAAFADGFVPVEGADGSTEAASEAPPPPSARRPLESMLYERVRDGESSLLDFKKFVERECIVRALDETEGNITRAARLLGMKRPRLSQLVKQYDLLDKKQAKG
ncbi:MAG TPA: sigma 54-interacting transcriptional regulator [Sandaracinaceae bacterium LLY-WYZ-13_1]|nr:sigma 54-interacting transcriptional regulator [Sandaracinaceae bacterium LLY-WYZ-13_1]